MMEEQDERSLVSQPPRGHRERVSPWPCPALDLLRLVLGGRSSFRHSARWRVCVSHSNKPSGELHSSGGIALVWSFIRYSSILPF